MTAAPGPATAPSIPELWHFPISHFNEKVRWALDWKRIPHRRRALSVDYLPRAWLATRQPRLPILFLDGTAIADSTRIIAALEDRYPEPALYPAEAEERRRALALEDWLDEEVGSPVRTAILAPLFAADPDAALAAVTVGMSPAARRVIRPLFPMFRAYYYARHGITAETTVRAPEIVRGAFDRIAREVGASGYLVGDRFSVADLTAAAMLAPIVAPREHEYLPPEPVPGSLRAFRAALAEHPASAWVRETYRRHRGTSAEVRR